MNCKHCGGPITCDEEQCSYCGSENDYFITAYVPEGMQTAMLRMLPSLFVMEGCSRIGHRFKRLLR